MLASFGSTLEATFAPTFLAAPTAPEGSIFCVTALKLALLCSGVMLGSSIEPLRSGDNAPPIFEPMLLSGDVLDILDAGCWGGVSGAGAINPGRLVAPPRRP